MELGRMDLRLVSAIENEIQLLFKQEGELQREVNVSDRSTVAAHALRGAILTMQRVSLQRILEDYTTTK